MDPYLLEQNASDDRVGDRAFLPKIAKDFRRFGHGLAFIPVLGSAVGWMAVAAGYVAEVSDSLIHGKFVKALKQSVMGVADTAVTGAGGEMMSTLSGGALGGFTGSLVAWAKEPLSLMATGKSAGELARTATGTLLDMPEDIAARRQQRAAYRQSVQQMQFGRTTGVAPASVGYAPGYGPQMDQAMPGQNDRYWFNQEAQRRGADPEQAYRNFASGNGGHIAALEDARARGPQEQQLA